MQSTAKGNRRLLPLPFKNRGQGRKPFFLLLLVLATAYMCSAQNITLAVKNAPFETVVKQIGVQAGLQPVYVHETIEKGKPVTVTLKKASLKEALENVFRDQPLTYLIEGEHILIKTKPGFAAKDTLIDARGRIIDEKGEPLVGASVSVKGEERAAATNRDGTFLLRGIVRDAVLVISSVGYQAQEIALEGRMFIQVQLMIAVSALDETVVIAYGQTTRRLNTGSVSRVTADEIGKQPVSNPLAALEGRVAGMFITQSNGMPGSNFSVLIRGRNSIQNGNSPLYLIDGVPFLTNNEALTQRSGINANNPFNSIAPEEIESIEILKDADATAIYGSRGANGVVLITTKKAKAGKTSVDVNAYRGWGKVTRTMSYLNTPQYLQMRKEAFANDGVTPTLANAPDLLGWDSTRYTDWKKMFIGGTAHATHVSARLSGGTAQTRFSVGTNYYKETTVFPGSFADNRVSVNLNVSHRSSDQKFSAIITSSYSSDKSDLPTQDLTSFVNLPPNMYPLYDSAGNFVWREAGYSKGNPLATLQRPNNGLTNRLTGNIQLEYKLTPELSYKTSFGYNAIDFDETASSPIASQDPAFNPKGSSLFGNNSIKTWIIEPQLNYKLLLGSKNKIEALMGITWQDNQNKTSLISGSGYTNDALLHTIGGAATTTAINSFNQYRYEALYGRINFNHGGKYIVNLTGRRDGSSRFGPGKQFSNFGAIGAAWIFSEEKSLKESLRFLSYGKLRASYGTTGNDQIGNYQYLDTYSNTIYPFQGNAGLRPTRLYNPDYSWEINKKLEAAIELGLLKDRFLLTIDWFRNRTGNQIIRYNLPAQTGFDNVLLNFPGVVQNEGLEFELKTNNIERKDFVWNSSVNLSFVRNKLIEFPGLSTSSYASSYIIGKPLTLKRGYVYLGVDPQTGIYQFEDVNKDGAISSLDYVYLGTTNPVYFGGLGNSIQYKKLTLDFLFQFVCQRGLNPHFFIANPPGSFVNQPTLVLNHWQKPGDVAVFERYTQNFVNPAYYPASFNAITSSAALTDASYIRLKNVSLSYSLKSKWMQIRRIETCKIYFQAQNVLTITHYKGADPESQSPAALPPLRMLTTGLQINF